MNRLSLLKLLPCGVVFLLLTGFASYGHAAQQKPADPRTMTFPGLVFKVPESTRVVLDNGMTVLLYEDHELPLVSMTAYVRTGSIYEPAGKTGLASLTGDVMRSGGTTELPPEKLDAELEFMASAVESSIGPEVGNVSLATLTRNLDRTLEIFSQVLRTPAFRADRVTLAKNNAIEAIRRQNDNPKGIADRELRKVLYAGHPLGRYATVKSVEAITRDDLVAFHRTYFHPNNIILAVAGDFNRGEVLKKLDRVFAGWEKAQVSLPKVEKPAPITPEVLFVHKDVNQSVIRMGHLGIEKNNPDLYAIRVLDYILGGGFTSRLVTEIRSNQGLAYNVDSAFDIGRQFPGTFVAETETKSGTTAKAITLMEQIIGGMTKGPVSDAELETAKNALINSFIFGFAKPDAIVNMQARLEYFGYPKGYLENYRDNLSRVTKEDVLRVARTYLHPDAMVVTVVGNEKTFDQPLAAFGKVREIVLENGK
jgi:predicted Zn-dependent peptidase